jgi:microcin C transport system permease protein
MFSELTKDRIKRFKRIRRANVSLWILGIAFLLSLFCELIANDKPLYLRYKGTSYFPVFFFYPAVTFGGKYKTEADYLALKENETFQEQGFMIFPIIPHSPLHAYLEMEGNPPHPPSRSHWLGTDSVARDVLARLIYGFRICMVFALCLMILGTFMGVTIGGIQGYLGGAVDIVAQRLVEIWSSLPFLYVVILVGSIYGSQFILLLVIIAMFFWIGLSYYMRGEFLKLKEATYVRAARALGIGPVHIFFQHILPNALTPVITIMPFLLISGITLLTSLDFLGFGLPPPTPSWGEMLSQGLNNLYAPWIAMSTVAALFTTLLLATFIGEGVREAFDPKSEYRFE